MSRFSPFSRPDAAAAAPVRTSGTTAASGPAARPGKSRKFASPRTPQPLAEVLSRTDAFAPLRAGVEQIAAIQRDLDALLPDYLAASVEPGFIKDGKLALFAAHNALAARLRHLEPRLVADLQTRGWPLDGVRIRVRPQAVKDAPLPKQARMTPAGAAALAALSENLPPSPLQEALAKMAARHLKRR
ncbi:DciA family protein [Paraburkholderia sp. A1RO-5L]|uniref:DciA family protein n=1 Tax=unclassified Paraburkholderia TaxID=2615204 RepID=UPI003B97D9F5